MLCKPNCRHLYAGAGAEALGAMGQADAMSAVLRPLVGRAHRMDLRLLARLVEVAVKASSGQGNPPPLPKR